MIVNRTKASDVFGVALTTIDSWLRNGCPGEQVEGKWRIDTGKMYKWNMLNGQDELDLNQEKARESMGRQERLQLQISEMRGSLVSEAIIDEESEKAVLTVRNKLLALPNKIAPLVLSSMDIPEVESAVKDMIYEVLDDLVEAGNEAEV